jgi:hypothetical protein
MAIVSQRRVVAQEEPNPNQIMGDIALFNEDGTPFTGGGDGSAPGPSTVIESGTFYSWDASEGNFVMNVEIEGEHESNPVVLLTHTVQTLEQHTFSVDLFALNVTPNGFTIVARPVAGTLVETPGPVRINWAAIYSD